MLEPVAVHYDTRVCYALSDDASPITAATPSFVDAPALTRSEHRHELDVAPYATIVDARELLAAAVEVLRHVQSSDPRVATLERYMEFLARHARVAGLQMEPRAIAGNGTANYENEPADDEVREDQREGDP